MYVAEYLSDMQLIQSLGRGRNASQQNYVHLYVALRAFLFASKRHRDASHEGCSQANFTLS